MIAPTVGANADPNQADLVVGAQATIAYTGGAGVLQRSAPSYDGAVVASLAEGSTVSITEGPVADLSGQLWYGVVAASAGYVPAFTLAAGGDGAAADPSQATVLGTETAPSATASPEATASLDPLVSASTVQDTAGTLLPGTAMITDTNGDGARCRVGADYAAATIVTVPEGTVVTIAGPVEAGTWQPIICGESQYGYVHTDFVTYALGEEPTDVVVPSVVPSVEATVTPAVEASVTPPAEATVAPTDVVPTASATATETISLLGPDGADASASAEASGTATADASTDETVSADSVDATDEGVDAAVTSLAVGGASFGTGFVSGTNGDGVRCRSGASYSASTITVLPEGSAVTIRGAAQGEWMPVTCAGQSGFAHVSFISASSAGSPTAPSSGGDAPSGAVSGTATVTGTNGNGLNCRATASYSGSVIGIVAEGSQVSLRGAAEGEWQPVTCAGMGGYVNTAFISSSGGGKSRESVEPESGSGAGNPGGAVTGNATVAGTNGQGLICRGSASYSGAVLMVMPEGSSVALNGSAQGEWQPVQCGSQSGFAHSSFLSTGGGTAPPASAAPSAAPSATPSTNDGGGDTSSRRRQRPRHGLPQSALRRQLQRRSRGGRPGWHGRHRDRRSEQRLLPGRLGRAVRLDARRLPRRHQ